MHFSADTIASIFQSATLNQQIAWVKKSLINAILILANHSADIFTSTPTEIMASIQ